MFWAHLTFDNLHFYFLATSKFQHMNQYCTKTPTQSQSLVPYFTSNQANNQLQLHCSFEVIMIWFKNWIESWTLVLSVLTRSVAVQMYVRRIAVSSVSENGCSGDFVVVSISWCIYGNGECACVSLSVKSIWKSKQNDIYPFMFVLRFRVVPSLSFYKIFSSLNLTFSSSKYSLLQHYTFHVITRYRYSITRYYTFQHYSKYSSLQHYTLLYVPALQQTNHVVFHATPPIRESKPRRSARKRRRRSV